jgi:hypothetical protein
MLTSFRASTLRIFGEELDQKLDSLSNEEYALRSGQSSWLEKDLLSNENRQ